MRFQIISINGIGIDDLKDENKLLETVKITSSNLNNHIVELNTFSQEEIAKLFAFFKIDMKQLAESIIEIRITECEKLQEDFLAKNYLKWINISNRKNTMDEYGILLEVQNILRSNSSIKKYLVNRCN